MREEFSDDRGGPRRHRHRHAARRQGPSLSRAQSGRRGRCRSRPRLGDPRAAERTFQLLHQVVGRAGREEGRGVGYLQTHQPEHPVMQALIAQDREAFYDSEIALREATPIRRSAGSRACWSPAPTSTRPKASRASSRAARAAQRGRARARTGRGAARGDPRAASLSADGEVGAQLRSLGLSARLARGTRRSAAAASSSTSTSIRRVSS